MGSYFLGTELSFERFIIIGQEANGEEMKDILDETTAYAKAWMCVVCRKFMQCNWIMMDLKVGGMQWAMLF